MDSLDLDIYVEKQLLKTKQEKGTKKKEKTRKQEHTKSPEQFEKTRDSKKGNALVQL